jgi:hypothetical protein
VKYNFFFIFIIGGVGLSPGTAATSGLLYKPQMIDEGDCGAIGGMKIGRGNRSTRKKPAPVPLRPPQIPHDQTRARTRAAAVGSQAKYNKGQSFFGNTARSCEYAYENSSSYGSHAVLSTWTRRDLIP